MCNTIKSGNENIFFFLNSMVLPSTGANCRSLMNEEKKRNDRNRQTRIPITNIKDTCEAKKCMAYAETFILNLAHSMRQSRLQANFMGMIGVKSKSSLTSSVFFLSMWLFTYTFSPSSILFSKTFGVVTYIHKNSISKFATVTKNDMRQNRQLISINVLLDSNKSL
jgi:hypothetical protein